MMGGVAGGEPGTAPGSPPVLVLPRLLRDAILEHMLRELPSEGVGLLAAKSNPLLPAGIVAAAFYPGQNQDRSAIRYTMRPDEVAAAMHDMARRGLRLGAVVHSHPRTPPTPSATDLAEAIGPGVVYVIVGMTPAPRIRAWQTAWKTAREAIGYREIRVAESVEEAAVRTVEAAAWPSER